MEVRTPVDGSVKPVSKPGKAAWNFIKWADNGDMSSYTTTPSTGAMKVARSMYNTAEIASSPVYGSQWDAIMEFIRINNLSYLLDYAQTTYSQFGNYTGTLKLTGADPAYKVNNIYDIAGNVNEYTIEIYPSSWWMVCIRGGSYTNTKTAFDRDATDGTGTRQEVGFRVALYFK